MNGRFIPVAGMDDVTTAILRMTCIAVSYTHLDVYKRQALLYALFITDIGEYLTVDW